MREEEERRGKAAMSTWREGVWGERRDRGEKSREAKNKKSAKCP